MVLCVFGFFIYACTQQKKSAESDVMQVDTAVVKGDSIDQATGLVIDDALPVVVGHCTACHSAQLITQNRATREGWKGMIVWMQETQNLWDLGENEEVILDYLSEHYAPEQVGRRKNLENIEWYELE